MIEIGNACFALIDEQTKLLQAIHRADDVVQSTLTLLSAMRRLAIPILWTEQTPDKLGPSALEIRVALRDMAPIGKATFSCCGSPAFMKALQESGRTCVILAGVETHICVFQTVRDLVAKGYEVHVVAEAVSSRQPANHDAGLSRCRAVGAVITTVESLLFELLESAEHPAFRDVLKLVK